MSEGKMVVVTAAAVATVLSVLGVIIVLISDGSALKLTPVPIQQAQHVLAGRPGIVLKHPVDGEVLNHSSFALQYSTFSFEIGPLSAVQLSIYAGCTFSSDSRSMQTQHGTKAQLLCTQDHLVSNSYRTVPKAPVVFGMKDGAIAVRALLVTRESEKSEWHFVNISGTIPMDTVELVIRSEKPTLRISLIQYLLQWGFVHYF